MLSVLSCFCYLITVFIVNSNVNDDNQPNKHNIVDESSVIISISHTQTHILVHMY